MIDRKVIEEDQGSIQVTPVEVTALPIPCPPVWGNGHTEHLRQPTFRYSSAVEAAVLLRVMKLTRHREAQGRDVLPPGVPNVKWRRE